MKALITAIKMQLVTTLKEVSPALVTLDTQAMGLFAMVSVIGVFRFTVYFLRTTLFSSVLYLCIITSHLN